MPRPKKAGAPEPKKRSRTGCWPCKSRKVKCDEARPICANCQKQGETCDYSIRLNWDGRKKKDTPGEIVFGGTPIDFSSPQSSLQASRPSSASGPAPTLNSVRKKAPSPPQIKPPPIAPKPIEQPIQQEEPSRDAEVEAPGFGGTFRSPPYRVYTPPDYQPLPDPSRLYMNDYYFQPPRSEPQYPQSYERHRQDGASFANHGLMLPLNVTPTSTPPFFGCEREGDESAQNNSYDHPSKRQRFGYGIDSSSMYSRMPPPQSSPSSFNIDSNMQSAPVRPPSSIGTPMTPASAYSDEGAYPSKPSPRAVQDSPDLRRLSVNSLLSGPPGIPSQNNHVVGSRSDPSSQDWTTRIQDLYQDTTAWGVDRGFKDLDIPRNDDANALQGVSPVALNAQLAPMLDHNGTNPVEFGFGMETNNTAFEVGGYYDKPVAVTIPRILEPLPRKLLDNPMNLLYFHHFLNHTAGCLIPHNCSSNPFRSILPQMAVRNENLMNLLLAYSASHRARLLRQPEPATRIALWVENIFPNLRRALDNPSERISNENLATAIMLASLEIISPKAFGISVPWQQHLDTARQMIAARGGPQRMQTVSRKDKVSSFLWSWFAYLDVLGSLSGGKANAASSSWILDYDIDVNNDYQIDCILGFTSKCIRLLAKIAELARICDQERVEPDYEISPDWRPSEDTVERAAKLEADLADSRMHPAKPCTHMQSNNEAAYQWDSIEMAATNEAFHWAGLVHLHRRILGKPSTHPDVQNAVREIFGTLYKIKRGSSAEACLLFPMFTAGCDTQDSKKRGEILDRIKGVERFGMTQVHKARTLMERVWETGKPWETLVAGEFFG